MRHLLCALAIALAACKVNAAGDSTDGRDLFASQCSACHGPTGRPTEMMVERFGVKDLTAPDVRRDMTPASVERQIRRGSANFKMPSFEGQLTDAQIRVLAEFVAGSTFVPPPP
ncbi:MAG: cytochrome c [Deltaproteobacteria bacterium]|nr:cytochrome c [Deltaproteobacteria bacterium]MCW5808384.1 cytochrome c [Deltaproteobacteria bacterium]